MGWLISLLRGCLHALQVGGAITACVFYASKYDGVTKDNRWKFAIVTAAFSICGTIVQSIFYGSYNEGLLILSGVCSGKILILWTGVLGTFARSFMQRDASNNKGVRMMQIAVYVDAANMFIWFLTILAVFAEYHHPAGEIARRTTERQNLLRRTRTDPSTPFVSYGWDQADIEAQTLEVLTAPPISYPRTDTQSTQLSTSHSIIPEFPPPVAKIRGGATASRSRDVEGGKAVSRILPVLPEGLQDLDWPLQEVRRLSAFSGSRGPPFQAGAHNTSTDSGPSNSSQHNFSRPLSFEWDGQMKECPICLDEHPSWTFPLRISKACSNHEQEACRVCIDKIIAAELDSNIFGPVHCAECRAPLDYEEVKSLARPSTFARYEKSGLREFVSNNPDFVWCQNPNCSSGQEHVGGVDQPIVTCEACGFKTCFKHQIPWHEEMLCDEYDGRVKLANDEHGLRTQQELASITAIHEVTKPCANKACKVPIQKTAGCDHMSCYRCKHEFCWVCGEDWGGVHRMGCGFR